MGSSFMKFIMYFPEIKERSQQFSCCCHSVLYQHPLTQLSVSSLHPATTSCTVHRPIHTVLFQFSCMTPKKVESASIEMRAWGRSGITNSSSSSWCSCTMPVTEDTGRRHQRRPKIGGIKDIKGKTDIMSAQASVLLDMVTLQVSGAVLEGWTLLL